MNKKGTIMKNLKQNIFQIVTCSILFYLSIGSLFTQTPGYYYSYDASGNRETRTYTTVFLKHGDTTITQEDFENYQIRIYPNPIDDHFKVEINQLSNEKGKKISFILRDLQGKVILKRENESNDFQVDMQNQPNGTYFLNILINDKRIIWKIVKSY